jgi:hypothetical protein
MRKSVQKQNRRQNQRKSYRQYTTYGGNPSFAAFKDKFKSEPKVVCAENQFLYKNTCVEQCPEGMHGDVDCTPHECISGTRDGFLNSKRSASCRIAKATKAAYLKRKYDNYKAFVTSYEATMPKDGSAPTDAALAKVENAEERLDAANEKLDDSATA